LPDIAPPLVARPAVAGRPMRVLIVVSNMEYGGAQRQIVELANHVDPAQCELHICSLSSFVPLGAQLRDQSRLHIVPKRAKFDLSVIARLVMLIRRLRADVVHGFLFDAEIAAQLAGWAARVPAVLGSERNTRYELKRVQLLAHRLTRGCVDMVVANSNDGAAFSAEIRGHSPAKYRVVRNGVDLNRFRPVDGAAIRTELGWTGNELIVGMFASLKQQKNHPLLLRAAPEVLRRFPQTRFLFVGDVLWGGADGSDSYADGVRQQIKELGIESATRFLGNRSDLPQLYSACDLTVLPSLYEGTPNVLLESMACGCPVVATDVADNRIVAPDGKVGRIVPSMDHNALSAALCDVLGDTMLRQRMGVNARAWAEQEFATPVMAGRMLAVYREALGRSQPAALVRR
jgi:glycosyltransferase involved in cell wall biosynthesis